MLLKSLEIENFRQFRGKQTVNFSTDKDKNVTIIMGENGSGKTTIAQAFMWCLYAEVSFEDKVLLCRAVSEEMNIGEEANVKVKIELTHKGRDYTIIRKQVYKKEYNNSVTALGSGIFEISYKNYDGQQEFVKPLETELVIKEILPKDLAGYFFFDGERIEKMSKEIRKGRSKEFGLAVKNLLGLSSYTEALEHLKPTSKYSVIGNYNERYDSTNNDKILEYTRKIEEYNDRIQEIDKELEEIDSQENTAIDKCDELQNFIKEHEEGEKLAKEKEKIEQKLRDEKITREKFAVDILKEFNTNVNNYMMRKLILDSLNELPDELKSNTDIPHIHAETIEHLKQRGKCICGNPIEIGNEAYNNLTNLLSYIPPQSIGTLVSNFKDECMMRAKNSDNFFESLSNKYSIIRQSELEVDDKINEIKIIEEKLKGTQGIGKKQEDLWQWQRILNECKQRRDALTLEKGGCQTQRDRQDTERNELALKSDKNRKIEICKAYAEYMFTEIAKDYSEQENTIREKLEKCINDIFDEIYDGGLSLSLDSKYNIQVTENKHFNSNYDIETSTAQSIVVILAFISGVIKLAREKNSEEESLVETEAYPLVMDAPLSAFDKKRIKNICEVLPNIAEQIVIFIKDTDGEIAKDNMSQKIGKQYYFRKENEYETSIEG